MNGFLRALAWVAPQAAMRRARAMSFLDAVDGRRAYDGATTGRRGAPFLGRGSSANVEIGAALTRLRDRSREMVRNNWAASRVLDVIVAHAIGTGISLVWNTGSDRSDKTVQAEWEEFCAGADVEGELDFAGQQALALRSALEGGDSVLRFLDRPLRAGSFPLQLQLLEGDLIDSARDGMLAERSGASVTRLGVGLGEHNRREGYWLLPEHPGEGGARPGSSQYLARSEVIHLYRPQRPGQVRGVPLLAPVLMTSRDIADLMEAIIVKARTEACFAGFVEADGDEDADIGQDRSRGGDRRITELAPGMVHYLSRGEKISFANPSGSGQYDQVLRSNLMAFAAGGGVTYDQLTGDLSQANYSSLRAGKIEFRRLIEQLQWLNLVPMMMRRVRSRFLDTALSAGRLRPRRDGYPCDYVMPAVEPIDPKKDLEADILAVRSGRMTPQQFIGAWGFDWRQNIADTAAFFKESDGLGLALDIDSRRTSRSGVAQDNSPDNSET